MLRFYSNPTVGNRTTVVGELTDGVLKIAVSRTGKKEMFIRKKGRAIAEGRLAKGRLYTQVAWPKEAITSEEFVQIALPIAEEVIKSKKVISDEN